MIRLGVAVLVLAGLSSAVLAAMTPEQRAAILAATADFSAPERWETLSGGSATNRTTLNRNAFSQPSANLSFEDINDAEIIQRDRLCWKQPNFCRRVTCWTWPCSV
jgi:hypothetical protein